MSTVIKRRDYAEGNPIISITEDTFEQVVLTHGDKKFFVRTVVSKHGLLTCYTTSWYVKTPTGNVTCSSYDAAINYLWKPKETV
jgi:hypothetical protein